MKLFTAMSEFAFIWHKSMQTSELNFLLSVVRKCLIAFMEDPSAGGNYWHDSLGGVEKDEPATTDVTFHIFIEQSTQTGWEGMNAAVCEPCDTGACHPLMTM